MPIRRWAMGDGYGRLDYARMASCGSWEEDNSHAMTPAIDWEFLISDRPPAGGASGQRGGAIGGKATPLDSDAWLRHYPCLAKHIDGARRMTKPTPSYRLGGRSVNRMGYGAMQLAGPGVFGPPRDRAEAIAVLREAVDRGVNHIDTCDYYGPHITNQVIREALHPYPQDLVIVTKVSSRRGPQGEWLPAMSPDELTAAVHDNLRNLGIERIEVVNLRSMFDIHAPAEGSLEEPLSLLAELQQQGLIEHIGLSNVTPTQIEEGRRICKIACVQNQYNLAARSDDALIDSLAESGTPYVPFFPLGGFSPLQSAELSAVAAELEVSPMQVALAWLLQRSPNILLIPGTSNRAHLRENLAATDLVLAPDALTRLDAIAGPSAA